jgi:DNA-directed RNA polymerase subunit beta
MQSQPKNVYRERVEFSKIRTTIPIPNLIEIQKKSYERFLQMTRLPSERDDAGLQSVFKSVFPISDFRENSSLEFIDYSIGNWECKCGRLTGLHQLRQPCSSCGHTLEADPYGEHEVLCPQCGTANGARGVVCEVCENTVSLKLKYDVEECQERGMTYAVPLKVTIRLVVWNKDAETGVKTIRDIKEQEVYFGDVPLMTDNGTFIINGTERVVVSQLHRSPGAFFHSEDRQLFVAQIIPYRGSWVEFEYDTKNLLYVRIDRKRKFLASVFLRALGLRGADEIIRSFYTVSRISLRETKPQWAVGPDLFGRRVEEEIKIDGSHKVGAGKKIGKSALEAMKKAGLEWVPLPMAEFDGGFAATDVVDPSTGEVILEANEELSQRVVSMAQEKQVEELEIFFPERDEIGTVLSTTLRKDTIRTHEEALIEIYRRLRPGDPPTLDSSRSLFENMFFNPQKYDFSRVGRLKLNTKLSLDTPLDEKILHPPDFYAVIKYLLALRRTPTNADDIDHLGNRRVRSVGELLENQFRIGLVRMERAIKEKMSVYQEMATAMPHDLINAKPVMAAIREFFGSSQLSQFMDQTNPLSEITHKRRLSALGPGGLSRERAGFEVRDVHPTHYGRICPIETPEGPNIGLISSLSCYARINEFGFIESPYRRIREDRATDYVQITNAGGTKYQVGDVVEMIEAEEESAAAKSKKKKGAEFEPYSFYLSAWEEDQYIIAQANARLDDKGNLIDPRVNARQAGDFILAPRDRVEFIDVSPKQLVSVAASLIPFLEHDDANRALMGSNMQRQAVPLLQARSPFVGTGMEHITARDSGAVVSARRTGTVDYVDSQRVVVRVEGESGEMSREMGADIYSMTKFRRSNQNTCINQKPIVRVGDRVAKGQVLADGPCTELGELALGRNVLVAFMPWRGYNFEDAILVSERMVKEDYYTSIHIEEFETESRDTKLGPEEITRDIPNVSEGFLKDLDDSGIIRIGAYVKPGDILVGKVTPKGETQLTPEEKLLRAIFGEKAGDVRDASLLCPPGIDGIIVGVKIFSRKGIEKDDRAKAIEAEELDMMEKNLEDEIRILHEEVKKRVSVKLDGQVLGADLFDDDGREKLATKGTALSAELLHELPYSAIMRTRISGRSRELEQELRHLEERTERQVEVIRQMFEEKKEKIRRGDELPPGVIKLVKVYVAMKRKLSVGDKMAGRHGNKGVIARVLPEEDMPHLPDGTPVEIVLNPLGVPSRMNVGQILETHLGWAAHALGMHFATPVFDGATEEEIKGWLEKAGLPSGGKSRLVDGMTGEEFEQDVTVGYIYMLKLSHLVDDKIHARSIGPYSLITQQPLGGKAQFGGQRFGEMEVWALEAYGAAHILQELLTAKSDDVTGRAKIYEAIVKGDASFTPGLPESFNVLIRELQALCLDVELLKTRQPAAVLPEGEEDAEGEGEAGEGAETDEAAPALDKA